jgi:hypothetical protein
MRLGRIASRQPWESDVATAGSVPRHALAAAAAPPVPAWP